MNNTLLCFTCKEIKEKTEFYKASNKKRGFKSACKSCTAKNDLERYRSKEGVVLTIYKTQRSSSKRRGHNLPNYTFEELKKWCFNKKDFHKIYDSWAESNFNRWEKPSIDRVSNEHGYSFDNMQIMTWSENDKKQKEYIKKGLEKGGATPVVMYSNGSVLKKFWSQAQAERETGISQSYISYSCNSGAIGKDGVYWRFECLLPFSL